MRQYETMVLLSPDLEEEAVDERIANFEKQITDNGGEILSVDRWGKKRLAYAINKQRHGIYFIVVYKSDFEIIQEIERQLRLDEDSWRYMTVRMDDALLRKMETNVKRAAARLEHLKEGRDKDRDRDRDRDRDTELERDRGRDRDR
ncbi:MAG: 30S ribosomal protein S6 [Nitrospinota bacterium]